MKAQRKPRLYFTYRKDGEKHMDGPFFTASIDGLDIFTKKWVSYSVQKEDRTFTRITVPWYHTIEATE